MFTLVATGCHKTISNSNGTDVIHYLDRTFGLNSRSVTQLTDLIEVQFKNTRKGYFHNSQHLPLEKGVKVAVEANPGYDVGEVVLTGKLVELQIKKNKIEKPFLLTIKFLMNNYKIIYIIITNK